MNTDNQSRAEPIAIVGMGCVFPGAVGIAAFLDLLRAGRVAVRDVPPERWDAAALHDPDADARGRILTRRAATIDEADRFDPEFFGLSQRDAREMDPRQRLMLKTAWWALEDAGMPGWGLSGQSVGVFLGASNGEFGGSHANLAAIGASTATGHATSVLANRLSYLLGFMGPSLVVDTACSSSLIAVHLACAALRSRECELAIAGGVSLMLRPDASVAFSRARMLAADGRCKPFAASADGYGRGEGAGAVVLKRLSDACRDGDRIVALVLGSAVNHNGQSNGITAPSARAQEALIRQAIDAAGIAPEQVDVVEAHGTGTLLGDPIEARALGRVLGAIDGRAEPLPVGSVKSNIGHLEAAAGVAGLIKLALSLRHREIPASLGFDAPNPHIDFQALNLAVPTALAPLPDRGRPATGAVSSFGFGGANCHLIAAAPPSELAERRDAHAGTRWPHVLVLSAASDAALNRLAAASAERVRGDRAGAARLAVASHVARSPLKQRFAVVASDADALAAALERAATGAQDGAVARGAAPRRRPPLAFFYAGQGAQFPGMAAGLLDGDSALRSTLEQASSITGLPIVHWLERGGDEIGRTEATQPLMVALQVGLTRHWAAWGVEPDIVIGHSLGDFAAAVAAGALPFDAAMRLVALRGRLTATLARPGGMVAVAAAPAAVTPHLAPGAVIAVDNGPEQLSVAGDADALAETVRRLAAAGIAARPLPVSAAFHSPAMDPVLDAFRAALAQVPLQALRLPMICNRTGAVLPAGTVLDAEFWVRHLREPVRFADGVRAVSGQGVALGLEIGPSALLSRLAPLSAPALKVVPSLTRGTCDREALLGALGALWVGGVTPNWRAIDGPGRTHADLPLYPFDDASFPLLADGTVVAGMTASSGAIAASDAHAPPLPSSLAVATAAQHAASHDRTADIGARLRSTLAEVLETSPDRIDPAAPFVEMGADSLVLLTAAKKIEAAFGVRIPVRAFFDELSTMDALAAHLAALAPPPAEAPREPAPAASAPADFVAQVVREQLDLMRRQLALIEGRQAEDVRTKPPATGTADAADLAGADVAARAAGPTRRADTAREALSPRRRAHLDKLIRDYTHRTAGSRALAERYRDVMADSRASAGFRPSIKEMLYPIVCRSAAGATFEDVDGNRYLDISMGFGVQLFGHAPDFVAAALRESLSRGLRLGPQSDRAGEAAAIIARLSGQDRVAFVNSGTEAVMVALRLARTVTGRERVVIFRGAYHGHFDGVLAEAADPADPAAGSVPAVPGVAPGAVADTLVLEYGDEASLDTLAAQLGQVAAVLVEPVQSRRPDLQPAAFLHRLRALTEQAGVLLIFDELITGFRIAAGGAQAYFGVKADLVAYGKILGGGLPIGALAGRADVMAAVDGGAWRYGDDSAPAAETTLFAGTFNKNPLSIDACIAVLTEIERRGDALYVGLNDRAARLHARLEQALAGTPIGVARFGSVFRFVFARNLDLFFYHLLLRGIYVWEGRTCFLSAAHTDADCDRLAAAVADTVAALRDGGILDEGRDEPVPDASGTAARGERDALPMIRAQRQLAALAEMDPAGAVAYALPLLLDLDGPLDADRLRRAVEEAAARHDGLWAAMDPVSGTLRLTAPGRLQLATCAIDAAQLDAEVRRRMAVPFDLAAPPLLRATLFALENGAYALLLLGHHAAVDGFSLQVLAADIAACHGGAPLPRAASLRRLLDAHREAGRDGRWAAARDWWRARLADAPAGLDIDIAAPRPPLRAFHGGRAVRRVDAASTRALRERATAERASLLAVLLTGFAWLLTRHGAADMVIGVPFAGRAAAGEGAERLVGYCTHLLPIRLHADAADGTAALLARTRSALMNALEHADYPFAHIVDDLALTRDPARPLLVPVTFNLDRVPPRVDFGAAVGARLRPLTVGAGRFDLACNVVDGGDGLTVELDYDEALFDGDRAQRLADEYLALLGSLADGADRPLHDGAGHVARWATVAAGGRRAEPLAARWRRHLERAPEAAVVAVDGDTRLTRAALDRWSDAVAGAIDGARVAPGPVALLLSRTEALPVAMLACWKAARAWVPIEPATPAGRVADMLRGAGCALVLHDAAAPVDAAVHGCATLACPSLPQADRGDAPRAWPVPNPDDVAYVLFTSGSTGQPKPVAVPHRAVEWYLQGLLARIGEASGLSCGLVSTVAADLGLTATLPALFDGGCLCIQSDAAARDPLLLAAAHRRRPVDLLKIVPSHLEALLAGSPDPSLLPGRLLVLGGEPARPGLLSRLLEIAPPTLRVMNHYGPTEATVGVAMGEWARDAHAWRLDAPLAGAGIVLLDDAGRPAPAGVPAQLHVGGPQVALGYPGCPDDTAARFRPQPSSGIDGPLYATGDLARVNADGTLTILGRTDDQVKIRGYRVEPGEVAAALEALPGVASAAVVAADHPVRGKVLVAYVAGDGAHADPASLARALRDRLPDPMRPAQIVRCSRLPLTANGKLDRHALPAPDWHAGEAGPGPQAGAGATGRIEAALVAVWRELFGRTDIGVHDEFFALGGDSILGIRMVARLHRDGLRLQASDLYRHPTIAALAPWVRAVDTEAEQGVLAGPVPLLPAQHRWLALGAGLRPHANLSLLLELDAAVTPERVVDAWVRLLRQHDGLRIRAGIDAGEAVQVYGAVEPPPLHRLPAGHATRDALTGLQALADPAASPLVLGWLDGAPGALPRLLIVMHHWIADAVSCAILLDDLARLLRDPDAPLGPKTPSLRQWAHTLAARAASPDALAQVEYWALSTGLPPPALPLQTGSGGTGAPASTGLTLSDDDTRDVVASPAAHAGAGVEDLLLAALTLALGGRTGEPLLYVELEGHGRTPPEGEPEPARTVGWFTARHPAWFDLTGVPEAGALAAVRAQRLAIPNRGADYGALRHLGPDDARNALAAGHRPEVSLNWLGQLTGIVDAPFRLVSWRPGCPLRGAERAPGLPQPHALAVEAMLIDGRLRLEFIYDDARFDAAAIDALAAGFAAWLVRLARRPADAAAPVPAPDPSGQLDADDLAALAAHR
ncbi:hybrid non-ribosomal peptide synthetase/type I polyketide synthase [Burkholderia ubonensis]|uniref:Peptide synthase n=1 Tax=Burkholderia ubonensis subsp. mesacidophila TaxID=265293 RepID=A0A2A4FC39_9BURK|nr:hybrid non-ribosomal peptide synthetase/type I polyketide synthase [Burkholderia ubonensis]PCE30705.1 peptide synthase [Burkholderia ubonensis subsp. mesacidophila]